MEPRIDHKQCVDWRNEKINTDEETEVYARNSTLSEENRLKALKFGKKKNWNKFFFGKIFKQS